MTNEGGQVFQENDPNQKSLEIFKETLMTLENSPAVKVAMLFTKDTMGEDVIFTGGTMDAILEHPDVKLYKAITEILSLNQKPE